VKADYILIIASSARMLAQAAKNAGLQPLVIDLFADLDTQAYAIDFKQINTFTVESLAPALNYFIQRYSVNKCIYGSGFEQHPESLAYLQTRLNLQGNTYETFIYLQNKIDFFAVLDNLSIPHPEISFTPPNNNSQDWLIKPNTGQGGIGIQRFRSSNPGLNSQVYWQKYQHGSQHSVLFLANRQQVQIIGFNTQWTTRLSDSEEFIFAGIINHCPLNKKHQTQIIDWLTKLVPVFGLKGLNSLDFIHADGQSTVLEINPRPPASMQLYDADLLRRHIMTASPVEDWQSCIQPLAQEGYTGYQIIYAQQNIQIPPDYIWQTGCADLPTAGQMCRTGQPICSIIAHQTHAHAVMQALNIQQHNIEKGLYSHGIQR
jgi:methenyltetrahydromethanopterin cyclohydrolase